MLIPPIVTSTFLPALWHGAKRVGSILLVLLVVGWLISPPFAYKYGKWRGIGVGDNQGYKRGYAQAIKDNPSQVYGANATVTNIQDGYNPILAVGIGKLDIGAFWRKH